MYAHYPDALPKENYRPIITFGSQRDSPIDRMPFPNPTPADLKFLDGGSDDKTMMDTEGIVGRRTFPVESSSTMRVTAVVVNRRKIRLALEATSPALAPYKPGTHFDFYFDEDKVLKAGDYETVVSEISKFFVLRN